jgi:hypothetical protein
LGMILDLWSVWAAIGAPRTIMVTGNLIRSTARQAA